MLERLKKRIPLLLMTVLLTAWISYAYLDFIQVDLNVITVTLWAILAVAVVELIMTNRWTGIATGAIGYLHFLSTVFPIPWLHPLAEEVNACILDTYNKIFWTDRHFFANEKGTVFLVFFLVALSIYLFYTKIKSVGLSALLLSVYIFFMEFYKVADVGLVIVCILHTMLALVFLYGYQWYHRGNTPQKKKISLKYATPLLAILLVVMIIFTSVVAPQPNREFQLWLDDTLQNIWEGPSGTVVAPRFSNTLFSKDGKIGGDISFSEKYCFSVISYENTDSLYLRGTACDIFKDDAWQTAIDTGIDKSLEEYYLENTYFGADGNVSFVQNAVMDNTGLFEGGTVTVNYDKTAFESLLNHTYMTNLLPFEIAPEDVYYDDSTYTYQKGKEPFSYRLYFLKLNRDSEALDSVLQQGVITSFSSYQRLSSERRKQLEHYYLQMPNEISESVTLLTERLTTYDTNDYERAVTIEKYLKNNHTYTLKPGDVPKDKNLVEYFLFDSKKGYCAYYASAMVIMCRSIGIPARYVVGYRVDNLRAGMVTAVKDSACHAWVEAFIPQLGWVTFDPVSADNFAQHAPNYVPNVQRPSSPTPSKTPPTPTQEDQSSPSTPPPTVTEKETETPNTQPATATASPTPSPTPSDGTITPPSTNTATPQAPITQGDSQGWWILVILLCVLAVGISCYLFLQKKKSTSSFAEKVPRNFCEQFYNRMICIQTFAGFPIEMGETISQYFLRLQIPQLEALLPILEECFYNNAMLTMKQYKMLKTILQQEEDKVIAQKGKLKWFLFRIKYKA